MKIDVLEYYIENENHLTLLWEEYDWDVSFWEFVKRHKDNYGNNNR